MALVPPEASPCGGNFIAGCCALTPGAELCCHGEHRSRCRCGRLERPSSSRAQPELAISPNTIRMPGSEGFSLQPVQRCVPKQHECDSDVDSHLSVVAFAPARAKVREMHGIQGSMIMDVLSVCLCPMCAICQVLELTTHAKRQRRLVETRADDLKTPRFSTFLLLQLHNQLQGAAPAVGGAQFGTTHAPVPMNSME